MAVITMRVDDADAAIVERYARLEGKTVSDFICDAVFKAIGHRDELAALHAVITEDDASSNMYDQVLAELRL